MRGEAHLEPEPADRGFRFDVTEREQFLPDGRRVGPTTPRGSRPRPSRRGRRRDPEAIAVAVGVEAVDVRALQSVNDRVAYPAVCASDVGTGGGLDGAFAATLAAVVGALRWGSVVPLDPNDSPERLSAIQQTHESSSSSGARRQSDSRAGRRAISPERGCPRQADAKRVEPTMPGISLCRLSPVRAGLEACPLPQRARRSRRILARSTAFGPETVSGWSARSQRRPFSRSSSRAGQSALRPSLRHGARARAGRKYSDGSGRGR